MDMRLEIVYYNKEKKSWYNGCIEGDGISWNMSSVIKVTETSSLKYRARFHIPLKRYVEYYIAPKFFLNEKGVDLYIQKIKDWVDADYVWVDEILSNLEGDY